LRYIDLRLRSAVSPTLKGLRLFLAIADVHCEIYNFDISSHVTRKAMKLKYGRLK